MTTEAFDKSVTDEINRRVEIYAREEEKLRVHFGECSRCGESHQDDLDCADLAPYIAKIPLRAEYRDIMQCAELYEESARKHDEESERLRTLARQAKDQAENLRVKAGL